MMKDQVIPGRRVRLRTPEVRDIGLIFQWENDPANREVSNTHTSFTLPEIESYVKDSSHELIIDLQLRLMIDINSRAGELVTIGAIDLFDYDPIHLRAGIGILIASPFRSKGFASDALSTLIDLAFGTFGMHQLYCTVPEHNHASLRLFEKHGFRLCGTKKEWINHGENWEDEHMLQLING